MGNRYLDRTFKYYPLFPVPKFFFPFTPFTNHGLQSVRQPVDYPLRIFHHERAVFPAAEIQHVEAPLGRSGGNGNGVGAAHHSGTG